MHQSSLRKMRAFREKRLAAQKEFVDKLRAAAKIEIDEANLAKVRIDTSASGDDGRGKDLAPPPAPAVPPVQPPLEEAPGGAGGSAGSGASGQPSP